MSGGGGSSNSAGDAPAEGRAGSSASAGRRRPGRAGGGGAPSARRRAREFALQGLYQWLVAGGEASAVAAHIRESEGFAACDAVHFDTLLHGAIDQAAALDAVLARHVDRRTSLLSPVEHAVLMIGVVELKDCLDIPYRVAINEAVELAKTFGGTDGHRYVNGVLDRCGAELRPDEARARRAGPPRAQAAVPDGGGTGGADPRSGGR